MNKKALSEARRGRISMGEDRVEAKKSPEGRKSR